jgi:hypothetical protein
MGFPWDVALACFSLGFSLCTLAVIVMDRMIERGRRGR